MARLSTRETILELVILPKSGAVELLGSDGADEATHTSVAKPWKKRFMMD